MREYSPVCGSGESGPTTVMGVGLPVLAYGGDAVPGDRVVRNGPAARGVDPLWWLEIGLGAGFR